MGEEEEEKEEEEEEEEEEAGGEDLDCLSNGLTPPRRSHLINCRGLPPPLFRPS